MQAEKQKSFITLGSRNRSKSPNGQHSETLRPPIIPNQINSNTAIDGRSMSSSLHVRGVVLSSPRAAQHHENMERMNLTSFQGVPQNTPIVLRAQNLNRTDESFMAESRYKKHVVFAPTPSIQRQSPTILRSNFSPDQRRAIAPVTQVRLSTDKQNQLLRKLKILESRVTELHQQKQNQTVNFNQQIRFLAMENASLRQKFKDLPQKVYQTSFHAAQQSANMEDMLAEQISKSLELMERIDGISRDNTELKSRIQELSKQLLSDKVKTQGIQRQKSSYKKQLQQLKDSIEGSSHEIEDIHANNCKIVEEYESRIEELTIQNQRLLEAGSRQEQNIETVMNQKQKRILELEENNYDWEKKLEDKKKEWNELGQQVATLRLESSQSQEETQRLRNRLSELERSLSQPKEECQKCKDLLKTVFKLNSQLNGKK